MVECPVCGATFKSLMSHAKYKHGLTTTAFREAYPNVPMVSAETRAAASTSCVEAGCGAWRKGMKDTEQGRHNKSLAMAGERNPFFGHKHTEKTKQQMSDNHADFTGEKNPFRRAVATNPAVRSQLSERTKAWWVAIRLDPIRLKAFTERSSASHAQAILDGKSHGYGRGHKHGWIENPTTGQRLYFRSSYEQQFLSWCFSNGRDVQACSFRIPYLDEVGTLHQYIPDFTLGRLVVEVKPKLLRRILRNPLKEVAGEAFCRAQGLTYIVVTEKELLDLGSVLSCSA